MMYRARNPPILMKFVILDGSSEKKYSIRTIFFYRIIDVEGVKTTLKDEVAKHTLLKISVVTKDTIFV